MALSPVRGRGLMKEECSKDWGRHVQLVGVWKNPQVTGLSFKTLGCRDTYQKTLVSGHLPKFPGLWVNLHKTFLWQRI